MTQYLTRKAMTKMSKRKWPSKIIEETSMAKRNVENCLPAKAKKIEMKPSMAGGSSWRRKAWRNEINEMDA